MAFRFEDLHVWHKGLDLGEQSSQLTKAFPKEELFILTSRIKRAADLVVSDLAEGSIGRSKAIFKIFSGYPLRSAIKAVGCRCIAKKRGYLKNELFNELYRKYVVPVKMITALRNSI